MKQVMDAKDAQKQKLGHVLGTAPNQSTILEESILYMDFVDLSHENYRLRMSLGSILSMSTSWTALQRACIIDSVSVHGVLFLA